MRISLENKKFILSFKYNPALVSAVKSLPSRRFDPDLKRWEVPISEAFSLRRLVSSIPGVEYSNEAESAIASKSGLAEKSILDSSRPTAEIEIPCPEGKSYLPYQKAGISYALARNSTLIGDEMGLGKTIQAIGFANAVGSSRVLIICPASLKLNWLREWKAWDTLERDAAVIENGKQMFPSEKVVICNYDIITKHKSSIDAINWDLLILDEAHYCKNPKATRTQAILGGGKTGKGISADRKIILTGTPILNRPIEAYPILKALSPEMFGNWFQYATRYCNGERTAYGWDVSGSSNLGELQERLRSTCMVRRLKADVLKELPDKRRQLIEVKDKKIIKCESKAFSKLKSKMENLVAEVELAKCQSDSEYKKAVSALNNSNSAAFSEMSKIRHETAILKVDHVINFLKNSLEESDKIVCFAHHKDVITKIVNAFPGCVSITGDTPMLSRQEAVDRFHKLLSVVCDGALNNDGMGFSAVDVKIGHSLAGFSMLSKKQAVIAIKLCKKYRRQLPEHLVKRLD